jgi:outer membrane immunogenic protein
MRRTLLATVCAMVGLGLSGAAVAADMPTQALPVKALPVKAPPRVVKTYSWQGFYVGGVAGYGWGSSAVQLNPDATLAPPFAAGTFPFDRASNPKGFLGGVEYGTNYQFGSWVLGTESDFALGDINSKETTFSGAATNIGEQKLTSLSTSRGRVGYAVQDNVLLFGTGGLADGTVKADAASFIPGCTGIGNCPSGENSTTLWGWAAGGGLEYGTGPWSVKLEYLHYDLGNLKFTMLDASAPGAVINASTRFEGDMVRVGANYRFDWTPWQLIFGPH